MTGAEILRTFNCGVGMLLVLAREDVDPLTEFLRTQRETLFRVGRIEAGEQLARVVNAQILR